MGFASKPCQSCGATKLLADFPFRKDRGIFRALCKKCTGERVKMAYHRYREVKHRHNATYYAFNVDKIRKQNAAYVAANIEQHNERSRRWLMNNPAAAQAIRARRRARIKNSNGSFSGADWSAIIRKQNGQCFYCFDIEKLTIEHVVPLSRGGAHDKSNIVGACMDCNRRKNARTPEEWMEARSGVC